MRGLRCTSSVAQSQIATAPRRCCPSHAAEGGSAAPRLRGERGGRCGRRTGPRPKGSGGPARVRPQVGRQGKTVHCPPCGRGPPRSAARLPAGPGRASPGRRQGDSVAARWRLWRTASQHRIAPSGCAGPVVLGSRLGRQPAWRMPAWAVRGTGQPGPPRRGSTHSMRASTRTFQANINPTPTHPHRSRILIPHPHPHRARAPPRASRRAAAPPPAPTDRFPAAPPLPCPTTPRVITWLPMPRLLMHLSVKVSKSITQSRKQSPTE
jgi:hypothetical protein